MYICKIEQALSYFIVFVILFFHLFPSESICGSKKCSTATLYFVSLQRNLKHTSMTTLSVNINKIATLRNARGGNVPDVQQAAIDCQRFGAQGITVHPRPDERHIRYSDVELIKPLITTEFNIEGYPSEYGFELAKRVQQLKGMEIGRAETLKEVEEVTKWLKDIVWCNGHDTAWIEKTIEKLNALKNKK